MSVRVPDPEPQEMYTAARVAALYGSDPKTVTRWAKAGKLISVATPGGHRRYPAGQFAAVEAARRTARDMEAES